VAFDAPTLTRFFLYIAIPLGSWIGGALVERLSFSCSSGSGEGSAAG
jgi:predicted MFS family arabinose efflux permease